MSEQDRSVHHLVETHRWLLDFLLKRFPDGSVNIFERDLRYLYTAGTGHDRLRIPPVVLIGRRLDEVYPADLVARVRRFLERAFAGEMVAFPLSAFGYEYNVRAWPLPEADGTVGAVVAIAQEASLQTWEEELSPRQRAIAALVAAGLTNKEIARRLGMSVPTVRNHVEHIMRRLGFQARTQIGVWVAMHGRPPVGQPGRWGGEG